MMERVTATTISKDKTRGDASYNASLLAGFGAKKHAPVLVKSIMEGTLSKSGPVMATVNDESLSTLSFRTQLSKARMEQRKEFREVAYQILDEMEAQPSSWPFINAVSFKDDPNYYEVIKEPMDLGNMRELLNKDLYDGPRNFMKDVMLIFNNCRIYNNETTPYAKAAVRLEKFVRGYVTSLGPYWADAVV